MHDARQRKAGKWRQSEPRLSPEALSVMWSKWNHKGHSLSKHWVTPYLLEKPPSSVWLLHKKFHSWLSRVTIWLCWCRAGLGFIRGYKGWPQHCQENSNLLDIVSKSPHSAWASPPEKALGEHSSVTVRTPCTHHYQKNLWEHCLHPPNLLHRVETNQETPGSSVPCCLHPWPLWPGQLKEGGLKSEVLHRNCWCFSMLQASLSSFRVPKLKYLVQYSRSFLDLTN